MVVQISRFWREGRWFESLVCGEMSVSVCVSVKYYEELHGWHVQDDKFL